MRDQRFNNVDMLKINRIKLMSIRRMAEEVKAREEYERTGMRPFQKDMERMLEGQKLN